ncbi:MAG: hypothetical protein AAF310_04580 [Myxococcota bacterium]
MCSLNGCLFDPSNKLDFDCDPLENGLYVNPRTRNGGERATGRSWKDPLATLQQAVAKAQKDPTIRNIYITNGIYTMQSEKKSPTPEQSVLLLTGLKNVKLFGGFLGDGSEKCLQDRRPTQKDGTVLSGILQEDDETQAQQYVWHVVRVEHVANVHLDNITIRGGRATQCTAVADNACHHGGGIYVGADVEKLRMKRLTFENNHASFGGAFYASNCPQCFFDTCVFRYNKAIQQQETAGVGGAIFVRNSTSLNRKSEDRTFSVAGGHFQHNEAATGGAIAAAKTDMFVLGVEFRHNKSLGEGGAIWLADGSVAQLERSWFINNQAGVHGGAISVSSQSTLQELDDNRFQQNQQGAGDDIFRETLPRKPQEDNE